VSRKKAQVLVIYFGDRLDPGGASSLSGYRLVMAGRDKKFGTRDDKAVGLASASYDPAAHTVTLMPRGKVPKKPLQLAILASAILDGTGRPVDGDGDGRPGGDFRASFNTRGVRVAARSAMRPMPGIPMQALDALLAEGGVPRIVRRRGRRPRSPRGDRAGHPIVKPHVLLRPGYMSACKLSSNHP
jgi:hypothetical protein